MSGVNVKNQIMYINLISGAMFKYKQQIVSISLPYGLNLMQNPRLTQESITNYWTEYIA